MNDNYKIRHVKESDLDIVLELSNNESKWVGLEEKEFFEEYIDLPNFLIVENLDKQLAGFIMGIESSFEYTKSKNFLWFKERYNDFVYIDRVVIDPKFRINGIASNLYDYLHKKNKKSLTCEVAISPRNEESIIFHEKLGFKKVGEFSSIPPKMCEMYLKE